MKSQSFYVKHFKKSKVEWGLSALDLQSFPKESFGNALGIFLNKNGFELIPKVERHDAYHMLTGYGTTVEDEIALQYFCFGNGKRTKYLLGVLLIGTLLLPEYRSYYYASYQLGKASNTFHHFDFKKLLTIDYKTLRESIFSETIQKQLIQLQHNLNTKNHGTEKK